MSEWVRDSDSDAPSPSRMMFQILEILDNECNMKVDAMLFIVQDSNISVKLKSSNITSQSFKGKLNVRYLDSDFQTESRELWINLFYLVKSNSVLCIQIYKVELKDGYFLKRKASYYVGQNAKQSYLWGPIFSSFL